MSKFYMIPGFEETTRRRQYQNLAKRMRQIGLEVVFKNVDWTKELSKQKFLVERDSILFGFSMGAYLARLIAQEQRVGLVLYASMTPRRHFMGGKQEKILVEVVGEKIVMDIKINLKPRMRSKGISLYGDREGEKADVIVKSTDHEITDNYIKEIIRLVKTMR